MDFEKAIKLAVVFFLTALALTIYGPARGTTPAAHNPAKLAAQTVVAMVDASGESFCSAVVVAPGVALTAAHCSIDEPSFLVQDGAPRAIAKWDVAPGRDVAMIAVPGLRCPCAPLAPASAVVTGADVFMLGFPFGGPQAITYGWVVGRLVVNGYTGIDTGNYILIRGQVRPGNSGGGAFVVIDGRAYLIGIVSATDKAGGIVFVVEVTL